MSSTPVVIKFKVWFKRDPNGSSTVKIEWDIESLLSKHFPRKYILIIEILDYANNGSNYRYFKLIIRLTISIIDYSTALEHHLVLDQIIFPPFRPSKTDPVGV
jgi:hypothetical protein